MAAGEGSVAVGEGVVEGKATAVAGGKSGAAAQAVSPHRIQTENSVLKARCRVNITGL